MGWSLSQYLGLRSGGPKHVTVGMSSFVGFCSAPDSPWAEVEAGVAVGVLCSLLDGGWGDKLCPRKPRLRFGERQRRRALNCRSSSPRRFPREVRRTGLLKLGSRRLRRERVFGDRWKESSWSSPFVSTMEGSLDSCKTAKSMCSINNFTLKCEITIWSAEWWYNLEIAWMCLPKYKPCGNENILGQKYNLEIME